MNTHLEVTWNPGAKEKLLGLPDKVLYEIARRTLDKTITSGYTPWKSGTMERTMSKHGERGVVKDGKGYYIGNYTDYAMHVYLMPENRNWTRSGSGPKWFEKVWNGNKDIIIQNAIARNKI